MLLALLFCGITSENVLTVIFLNSLFIQQRFLYVYRHICCICKTKYKKIVVFFSINFKHFMNLLVTFEAYY
jgi:hypothetical protein